MRPRSNGFTLVEMLIALGIFGMLTAAGVALLTLTLRTQDTSERLLGEVDELRRLASLLNADLALAAPRVSRDRDGHPRPAFAGGAGQSELLTALVRRGWEDEAGARHSSLQRIEYRFREGRIDRLAFAQVDGESRAIAIPLLTGVRLARMRFRNREGGWVEAWAESDPARLPRAVELTTESERHGVVRQLFAIGSGR
jgi:general secretion pathway protein J